MEITKPVPATRDPERFLPYFLIGLLSVYCHGFILTNDGTIWDSWYVLNFLETRNWATLHDFFNSVGMPLYGWLYRPFAFAPDIVAAFMAATFLCLLGNGILIYHLSMRLGRLARGEALALTLLAQAMPLFSAAQDFIMFFFIFTHTLFLAAALLATLMLEMRGWRRQIARGLAVVGFFISFSNAALLVFYGCFYLLFFFRYRQLENLPFFAAVVRFLIRFPEFLALPPAAWLSRMFLTPQYGWYASYNSPTSNLPEVLPNFLSFFQNVLPYHARSIAAWPADHPFAAALTVLVALLVTLRAPPNWRTRLSSQPTLNLVWFGGIALFLAVLPFAAAGKRYSSLPLGELSRHCILTGLPLAIFLIAALRSLWGRSSTTSRFYLPVVGCLVIVLASRITPVYLSERAQWIYSNAVLHSAVRNEAVRNSSVVMLNVGFSLVKRDAYALFGFSTAFGELTRFVTQGVPKNLEFFTPTEIGKILSRTTLLPFNFKRIWPGGQQIVLAATRNPVSVGQGEFVSRYLRLRYFGTPGELDAYLVSLVTLETTVLKEATPFSPRSGWSRANPSPSGVPTADFTNGIGMRMVRQAGGWWAAALETTQDAYEGVTASNPSRLKDPSRPVESISWREAMDFCSRLTAMERTAGRLPPGFAYRLPTTREFDSYSGNPSDPAIASIEFTRWQSEPAGSLPPNHFGLHDTFGNVWEWCLDWEDADHRFKVSKGGSWVNSADDLAQYRKDFPGQWFWNRGFRTVLAPVIAEPVYGTGR